MAPAFSLLETIVDFNIFGCCLGCVADLQSWNAARANFCFKSFVNIVAFFCSWI